MRAVIYARVSSRAQATEDKVSIPDQIAKGRAIIDARGWFLVHEPFVDAGISGQKFKEREALQKMLHFIRQGKADLVIVYDNDRIGRRSSISQHIFDEMDKFNVQLYSISQSIEPKAPAKYDPLEDDSGFITRTVTGMTSELFIRRLRRNIKIGRRNRVMKGRLYARAPIGYAYHYNPDGSRKLEIVEEKAAVVRRIFNSFLDGKGIRKIAIELNQDGLSSPEGKQWVGSTIAQVLNNHHYCGKTFMGKTWSKGDKRVNAPQSNWLISDAEHPPIVPVNVWRKVEELRSKKKHFGKTYGNSHVLSGICRCGLCDFSMSFMRSTPTRDGSRKPYLLCAKYHGGGGCERNSYQADVLLAELLDYLGDIAKNPALLEKVRTRQSKMQVDGTQSTVLALEKQLDAIAQRKEKSRYAFETGVDTLGEYQKFKAALDVQEAKVSGRLKDLHLDLESIQRSRVVEKHFTDLIADIPTKFIAQPLPKQKILLRSIIEKIVVTRKSFHVAFKF